MTIDWDGWRSNYYRMSWDDQREFYKQVVELHPEQQHWNGPAVAHFLAETRAQFVVELGGWDGSLAAYILDKMESIRSWLNYDIADVPQTCDDPRYARVVLMRPPDEHFGAVGADALVASHVFEHMKLAEIEAVIVSWQPKYIYLDCPVGRQPESWRGYCGSHALEVGSDGLLDRIESLGYRTIHTEGQLIAFLASDLRH